MSQSLMRYPSFQSWLLAAAALASTSLAALIFAPAYAGDAGAKSRLDDNTSPHIELIVPLRRDTSRTDTKTTAEWLARPTLKQMAETYPTAAARSKTEGKVRLECEVDATGYLQRCEVRDETPAGQGFGAAARALIPDFRMLPRLVDGRPTSGEIVFSIDFQYRPT